jgi:hypothetical protein
MDVEKGTNFGGGPPSGTMRIVQNYMWGASDRKERTILFKVVNEHSEVLFTAKADSRFWALAPEFVGVALCDTKGLPVLFLKPECAWGCSPGTGHTATQLW